jgi:integral membrane sensor domain MASE1
MLGAVGRDIPLVWMPVGLLAGALVLSPRRQWASLVALACAAITLTAVVHGRPLWSSVCISAVYGLEALLAGALLRRLTGPDFDVGRITHLAAIFVVAGIVPLVGAAVVATVAKSFGAAASVAELATQSWATDTLGLLLGAALVFGWRQYPDGFVSPPKWRALEMAATLVALAALSEAIFGDALPEVMRAPAFVMPVMFLAVFRLGPFGTSAAMTTVVVIGLQKAQQGHGPYMGGITNVSDAVLRGQVIGIMATVSFQLLACTVAERRRIAQERTRLVADLQTALAEIKTLRGFIPICAWCHKIRDDAGFWQEIESYVQTHTDAVFSHGICPECTKQEYLAIAERDSSETA